MSSRKYATPLLLKRNASRIGTLIYLLISSLTLVFICFLPLPLLVNVLLSVAVVGSVCYLLLKEWGLWPRRAVHALTWLDGDEWLIETANHQTQRAQLLADSLNLPYLVILNFRVAESYWPLSIVLYRDSCSADALRRLRVRLRMYNPNHCAKT